MVNWFGPAAWGAPVCRDTPRAEAPVGTACARCARVITDTDQGLTMPGSDGPVAFHLDCHLKSVLPHTHWPAAGLVPTEADGLHHGVFACEPCGMVYRVGTGWSRGDYTTRRPRWPARGDVNDSDLTDGPPP